MLLSGLRSTLSLTLVTASALVPAMPIPASAQGVVEEGGKTVSRFKNTGQILKRALWDTPGADFKHIFTRPFQDPARATRNTGILLGLIAIDGWTTRQFQEHLEPLGEDIRSHVEFPSLYGDLWLTPGLDGYAYTAIAGMYAVGVLTQNVKLQEAGVLTTKAILESYVVSHLVLKTAFGRHRPNRPLKGGELEEPLTRDPWDFFNGHRPYFDSNAYGTALPSFHATLYFAIARVMSLQFDNVWLPYTLSMFPLLYDIDRHRHWVSDLVAGAAIGTFIGTVVFENYHGGGSQESGHPGVLARLSWGITPFYGRWVPFVRLRF